MVRSSTWSQITWSDGQPSHSVHSQVVNLVAAHMLRLQVVNLVAVHMVGGQPGCAHVQVVRLRRWA